MIMTILYFCNYVRFGERFPALNNAYSKELRELAKKAAQELSFESFLREGVYTCVGGPSFESTAEINFLHRVSLSMFISDAC